MILIADSGSTKTDWILINEKDYQIIKTIGYNPYHISTDEIISSIEFELIAHIEKEKITKIYFYGAGCATDPKKLIIRNALNHHFPSAEIEIEHDLLAAARALLGKKKGFAAILGTGTNTCLYDGYDIIENKISLGYLLGDEGSGAHIGKEILKAYCRDLMPLELKMDFEKEFDKNPEIILSEIYSVALPNRYMASFCTFAGKHQNHKFIQELVKKCFTDFFENIVCFYPDYKEYTLNVIGSVAYIYKEMLVEIAQNFDMKIGDIIKSPVEGLINYHN